MLPPKNVNGERIEETSSVVGSVGNIGGFAISYQNEHAVKTEFDNYLKKMKAMGMDECLEAYQSAYDRYIKR